jgi:hypothetical protein
MIPLLTIMRKKKVREKMITLVKMKKKEVHMNLKENICLVVASLEKILLSLLVVAAVQSP